MKPKVLALIDCNNFFVSCERILRPDLENRPVVVMSSNDGCVVARSNETKALGIPMGAPVFKYQQLLKDRQVVQFSGNFELYGDVSQRITAILTGVCARIEVYSVDESFLDITDLAITDHTAWGSAVRARILREIGVPVSIGIGPTKTLAKLASEVAKRSSGSEGVVDLSTKDQAEVDDLLAHMPVKEVWGIGWRLAPKLRAEGVGTALALSQLTPRHAQQLMGIHGRQLVAELNGTACYPLEAMHKARQSIACTRTFGEDTSEAYVLEAAVASLAAKAAFRLRQAGLLTHYASVFVATNKHKPGYGHATETVRFTTPVHDSGVLISHLVNRLATIYNPRQSYHRAGVLLYSLASTKSIQTDLLGYVDLTAHARSLATMAAVDHINARFGQGRIHYAAEDLSRSWRPKHQRTSPHYTTSWTGLPIAHITNKN